MLAYRSSITHGDGAVRLTESYAMLTAIHLGFDLINLGFTGSAQMEGEMAHFIAHELDWDIATLEMGINVISAWPVEQYRERVQAFAREILLALGCNLSHWTAQNIFLSHEFVVNIPGAEMVDAIWRASS